MMKAMSQPTSVRGYRELSHEEIDLINQIKAKGAELLELHKETIKLIGKQDKAEEIMAAREANAKGGAYYVAPSPDIDVMSRHAEAEPRRWAAIGKTDIQTGVMALVRAVAQPVGI